MRTAKCIENSSRIPVGAAAAAGKIMKSSTTPNLKLLISLMAVAGAIIIGIAAYIFTHLSGLDLRQSIVLVALGVVGLGLIMVVLVLFLRGINPKK
jgi:ABC-type spermidine/putrescine transport system permease subunit II